MKKLFLTLVGVLMLSLASWAAGGKSYSFTFTTNGASDATSAYDVSKVSVSDIVATGKEYISGFAAIDKVYKGKDGYGLKFSSSSASGSITFNLSSQGKVNVKRIVVSAAAYVVASNPKPASLSVNGLPAQELPAGGAFADYTFTLEKTTELSTLTLTAEFPSSSYDRRLYVNKVTVYYGDQADPELMFSTDATTAYLGRSFTEPLLSYKTTAPISFSSSNPTVATVDATTGIVKALTEGTTVITASAPENDKFEDGEASYTLTVVETPIPEPTPDPSPLAPGVSTFDFTHPTYLNPQVEYPFTTNLNNWLFMVGHISLKNEKGISANKPELVAPNDTPELHVYGGNVTTVSAPEGLVITGITITSNNGTIPSSFTVSTGKFTVGSSIKWTGRANEVVFSWLNGTYGGEISYVVVDYTLDTKDANVAFATAEKTIKVGETYKQVATADTDAPLTYSSSNTAVATVAADGTVTAVAPGTAVITASAAETEEYKAGSASYTITVEKILGYETLAAWMTAKPAKDSPATVNAPVTAVYQNGKDLYITEGDAWILVYGDVAQTYTNGTVIPAGINGYYDAYNGQIEFIPTAGTFAAGTAGTAVEPVEAKADFIAEANSCRYVKLTGMKVVKDETVTSGRQYNATDADGNTVILWNRWNSSVTITEGDNMVVTGFVGMNKTVAQINVVSVVQGSDPGPGPGPGPEPGEYIDFNVKTALGSPTATQDFTSATIDPITLAGSTATGSNKPTYNKDSEDARFYAGNTFTVSTTGNAITKIVFNFSEKGIMRQALVTPTSGAVAQTAGAESATWEGEASSITFTVGDMAVYGTEGETKAGQFDFVSMYIYTGDEPGPGPGPGPEPEPGTTATFNFNDPTSLSPAQSCTVEGQEGAVSVDGITFTSGSVTLLNEKGGNTNPPRLWKNKDYDPHLRCYQGGLTTIAVPEGSKITSIAFNTVYECAGYIENIDGGSLDQMSYDGKVGTWTGEATSLTFRWCKYTSGSSSYSPYFNSIVVTYEDGEPGPGPGPGPEPEEGSLAAWLAAKPTSPMAITGAVTAVYQNGKDLYINQDNAWILVYGDVAQTYVNGDQIPAGIQGTYAEYNGQPEFVPVASTFSAGSTGTPLAAKLIEVKDVKSDILCQYVRLEGVTVTATETDRQFTVSDDTGDLVLWNRWSKTVTVTEGSDMTVYGFVGILVKDGVTTLQIYPTLVEGEGPGPEPGPTETTVTFNFNQPGTLSPAQSCTETGEAGAVNVTDITFSAGPVTLLNEIGTNKTNPRLWKNGDYDPHLRLYAGNLTTIATSVGKIINVTLNSVYAASGYVEALDGGDLSEMSYNEKVGQWNGEAQKLVFHWCKYTSGESQYSPYFNSISVTYVDESGIEQTVVTDNESPVEYYSIQGVRLANPAPGQIVIRRQGNEVSKILWK